MEKVPFTIEQVKNYLIENGIHPSFQRLKIFQHLAGSKEHPTVDMMYNVLCQVIPTLSKTTIYNTLNLFQKQGIVTGLTIEDNEVRYDADTKPHAHFKCTQCGKVYDIPFEYPNLNLEKVCDHLVMEYHFYMKGVCKRCSDSAG
ncbi:MAG: hypothetical protein AMS17_14170 [Spirochaetes bacterium DG_61]|jgi:Fur family peroxide stress response transcriptional regulator|nr:MAG: hypothetical protein AMS17_14170 [Spirochaetes bacterium DG_61]